MLFTHTSKLIQQAGAHNVSHTLVTIMTYLLLDDMKLNTLRAELATVFQDSKNMSPSVRDLEKAPYLSACIKEGLRYIS
jgi:cytochrome P450